MATRPPSEPTSASPPAAPIVDLPSASVLRHIVDVHCHPTDAPGCVSDAVMRCLAITVCAMSTHAGDQDKVRTLAQAYPDKVVPCFGYHPWFSHLISTSDDPSPDKEEHYRRLFLPHTVPRSSSPAPPSSFDAKPTKSAARKHESKPGHDLDLELESHFHALLSHLPAPRRLSSILTELRSNLTAFPNAMLGEVGVDRVFRVPLDYFASRRVLTPFTIPLAHQIAVLEGQLHLAVELGRNVSIHSVKAQQATLDLLGRVRERVGEEKWMRVSVDMHSCGLSPESWRDLEKKHPNIFLSLSTVINHKHAGHRALISACAPERILVESDYNDIAMCTPQTWDMVQVVADVKGWQIETEWNYSDDEREGAGDDDDDDDENGSARAPAALNDKDAKESCGAVRRLEQNWFRFRDGNHPIPQKKSRKQRKTRDYDSEGSAT